MIYKINAFLYRLNKQILKDTLKHFVKFHFPPCIFKFCQFSKTKRSLLEKFFDRKFHSGNNKIKTI